MPTVGVFVHRWQEINPEQHKRHVSCERREGSWSNEPKVLTVPDGWHVAESVANGLQLYDDRDQAQEFCRIGSHGKSVEVAGVGGTRWLPMSDAESVCCPTCGHPL